MKILFMCFVVYCFFFVALCTGCCSMADLTGRPGDRTLEMILEKHHVIPATHTPFPAFMLLLIDLETKAL